MVKGYLILTPLIISVLLLGCDSKELDPASEEQVARNSLYCKIEVDELAIDPWRAGYKRLRIEVINRSHSDVRMPGWVTVPGSSQVFSCFSEGEAVDLRETFPPAQQSNKTIIIIPPGEGLVWYSPWPEVADDIKLENRDFRLCIPFFKNCECASVTFHTGLRGQEIEMRKTRN